MKRAVGVVLALVLASVPALADALVPEAVPASYAGRAVVDYATGQMTWNGGVTRADIVYSDIATGPTGAFSNPVGALIADDLAMTAGGTLSTVDLSIYNSSNSTRPLQSGTLYVDFWNLDTGAYVNGFSYFMDFGATPLAAGSYTLFGFTGLESLGITLPQNVLAGESWGTDTVGGPNLGQVMFNPPTVGSSLDEFYLDNTGTVPPGTNAGFFYFGGNPVANFYWQIGVPEPSALALLALGGLALTRRR